MRIILPVLLVIGLAGCASSAPTDEPAAIETDVRGWEGWEPTTDATFTLESTDFEAGGAFPRSIELNRYGCAGPNIRPELHWTEVPAGTESIVITFTAEGGGPTNRWAAYNIDPSTTSLPALAGHETPEGAQLARVGGGSNAMLGPCTKEGEDWELWFVAYALDTTFDFEEDIEAVTLMIEGQGHVLASAELAGHHPYYED